MDSDSDSSLVESVENSSIESSIADESKEEVEIAETDNELEDSSKNFNDSEAYESKIEESFKKSSKSKKHLSDSEAEVSKIQESFDLRNKSEESRRKLTDSEAEHSKIQESFEKSNRTSFNSTAVEGSEQNKSVIDESMSGADNDSEIESDDEQVIKIRPKTAKNRILDSEDEDEKSDEDEKKRKSLYQEYPEGDLSDIAEDNVFSKATRRSMFGFQPPKIKSEPISDQESSSDDEDSDVIICETESDDDKEEVFESTRLIEKKMSSTIRSPLKELSGNVISKKELDSPPILQQSVAKDIRRVSKSFYEAQAAEMESLENKLRMFNKLKLESNLPDKGEKLQKAIAKVEDEIKEKRIYLKSLIIDEDKSIKSQIYDSFKSDTDRSIKEASIVVSDDSNNDFIAAEDVKPKYVGKVGMQNFNQQKALTVETLKDIHNSLDKRPAEDELAEQPKYMKVDLMKHQLHAIAFMMWRETQKPRGGILADDMGLGKTLTVIGLILKQLQAAEENEDEECESEEDDDEVQKENEWVAQGHKSFRDGGTLVVCPATLINQWEQEIKTKIKRNALEVNVFHGAKRIYRAKELAKYDVVITTYQIVLSEFKNNGCIFGVKWDRIVLDEGHIIRNYRSKQSEAVCTLFGKKRWVLSGTPIQNKEFDIYAAIKFLRCSPFDDLRYWRTWIETKRGSSPRLQTLLKSILLRRTKQQLQESGEIRSLPEKQYEEFIVCLNREERAVYNKILSMSQAIFAQFLSQHQEKHNNYTYDQKQLQKLHQKFARINNVDREIKAHEILTLLLRLRQICCHPGLVKEAIEKNELQNDIDHGDANASINDSDVDILNKLQNLKIGNGDDDDDNNATNNNDDVYSMDVPSSKIDKLMDVLRERVVETEDKAIIVSQWVSYLNIVKGMLEIEGIGYCELNGSVPVKFRNDIVVDFNNPNSPKKVMLLSITAGGVGLNLVGANTLFILDPHWNPQIEQQAQDRIYRFGQKKDVKIYKFICEDTIEEKILKIQKEKLDLATSTLTGAKRNASKLTIEDLKDLFGMK